MEAGDGFVPLTVLHGVHLGLLLLPGLLIEAETKRVDLNLLLAFFRDR